MKWKKREEEPLYAPCGQVLDIPVGDILPNPDQPRREFPYAELLELAQSIGENGLLNPISVTFAGGRPVLVAGERRLRAAEMLGMRTVPCLPVTADDRDRAVLGLLENLQRQDLNPMEEARGYLSLMRDYGLTQEETARSVGRSRPAVANALRLLTLQPELRELVETGLLSAGHARALIPLNNDPRQLDAANEVIARELSVRKTEQLAARLQKEPKPEPEKDPLAVDYAAEVSETLSRTIGRKVKLIEGKKGGRIEIEYVGADDREALIELLQSLGK
jgi:ParB family chromosome partitioning protein